mmetsp:Transcript_18577/g.41842  ORF Transcript_18577/g.41842 Transcript_18577/m.41842 type:complete len:87 (+) Transcript_18577:442-702(+)
MYEILYPQRQLMVALVSMLHGDGFEIISKGARSEWRTQASSTSNGWVFLERASDLSWRARGQAAMQSRGDPASNAITVPSGVVGTA